MHTDASWWEGVFAAVALSPVWISLIWHVWDNSIRPRLVPRAQMERLVDKALAHYGADAEEVLWLQEDHARRYSHAFEAGLLRRVRRALRRRLGA